MGALESPERPKSFFQFFQALLFLRTPVTARSPATAKIEPNPGSFFIIFFRTVGSDLVGSIFFLIRFG